MFMLDENMRERIAAVVASEGMELVHIEFKQGARSFLRIYIDKPGGVGHQDCKVISDHVSVLLDVDDPIPFPYVLEVSSPGLDRPLFREADFQRFVGRKVKIRTKADVSGKRSFVGRIARADHGVVSITDSKKSIEIPIAYIEKANLEIEL